VTRRLLAATTLVLLAGLLTVPAFGDPVNTPTVAWSCGSDTITVTWTADLNGWDEEPGDDHFIRIVDADGFVHVLEDDGDTTILPRGPFVFQGANRRFDAIYWKFSGEWSPATCPTATTTSSGPPTSSTSTTSPPATSSTTPGDTTTTTTPPITATTTPTPGSSTPPNPPTSSTTPPSTPSTTDTSNPPDITGGSVPPVTASTLPFTGPPTTADLAALAVAATALISAGAAAVLFGRPVSVGKHLR